MKLSVLVPLFNEEESVATLLERVIAAPLPPGLDREIIVADDGSTDSSVEEVERVAAKYPEVITLLKSERNQGKGAALRRAIAAAAGEFAIVQDADLEYDPREYQHILAPLLDGRADAVYGSRFMVAGERRVLYFWHSCWPSSETEMGAWSCLASMPGPMRCSIAGSTAPTPPAVGRRGIVWVEGYSLGSR